MRFRPLLATLPLAAAVACGARAEPARPLAAEIVRAVLVVHLSDGARCVALTPMQSAGGGFGNCAGLSWRLAVPEQDPGLVRALAEGWALMPGSAAPLVAITGPGGAETGLGLR
jgi:hypothetical protein